VWKPASRSRTERRTSAEGPRTVLT
jgi:hypothetical protein